MSDGNATSVHLLSYTAGSYRAGPICPGLSAWLFPVFPFEVGWTGQAAAWGPRDCCLVSGSSALMMLGVLLLAGPPFPCLISLSASLKQQWLLALSGHQAAACEFSGHLLLNCIPIESNTITLRSLRVIVNTCSLPSCSILAWSVSLRGLKRHLGWGWWRVCCCIGLARFASVGEGEIFI